MIGQYNDIEELKNMDIETFRSQMIGKFYNEYIQYILKKNKKEKIAGITNYLFEVLSADHDLCRLAIAREIGSLVIESQEIACTEIFDFILARYYAWDEDINDSQVIDMFQVISFTIASNCLLDKTLRKTLKVKLGFFK